MGLATAQNDRIAEFILDIRRNRRRRRNSNLVALDQWHFQIRNAAQQIGGFLACCRDHGIGMVDHWHPGIRARPRKRLQHPVQPARNAQGLAVDAIVDDHIGVGQPRR